MTESQVGDGHYKAYEEYSKVLRTWFVAYGIGAPVLLLNNDRLREAMARAAASEDVAILFLAGVACQVVVAGLNKTVNWLLYSEEIDIAASVKAAAKAHPPTEPSVEVRKAYYRLADWVSERFWMDLLMDGASAVLFALGTYKVFIVAITG